MKLSISFGALADPIKKQIEAAGLSISKREADLLQRDAEAITRCYIRGLIPDSVAERARMRLLKNIGNSLIAPKVAKQA